MLVSFLLAFAFAGSRFEAIFVFAIDGCIRDWGRLTLPLWLVSWPLLAQGFDYACFHVLWSNGCGGLARLLWRSRVHCSRLVRVQLP